MQNSLKMSSHIACISHVSADITQPALFLTARNGQKYIFGRCGEGLQRTLIERRFRTNKLSGVFLTGTGDWSQVSGLPGLLLSLGERNAGVTRLHVGAGAPLSHAARMIRSWRLFNFHRPLDLEATSAPYTDESLTIVPLTLADTSTSFVVDMQPTRGRFLVDKALALGVPRGRNFGLLSNGHEVTLSDGTVVRPQDVMEAPPTPCRVVVLDAPTRAHLADATERLPTLLRLARKRAAPDEVAVDRELRACYLFLSEDVDLHAPELEALFAALPRTQLVVSHPALAPNWVTLNSFAEFHRKLRAEFPDHFGPFFERGARAEDPRFTALAYGPMLSLDAAEPGDRAPVVGTRLAEDEAQPGEACAGTPYTPCADLAEPEIVTLGTGASAPSKYRNVISTLVRHRTGNMLFDAGEATVNTLARMYGEGRSALLRELQLCYISHMHADHHLGMLQVLEECVSARLASEDPILGKVVVAAPRNYILFCSQWLAPETAAHFTFVDLHTTCLGRAKSDVAVAPFQAPHFALSTCYAVHCAYSYSVTVALEDFKVSYSGDTRPNMEFAALGRDSDLLIHEATHENALRAEAVDKNHSTINEALLVAAEMRAKSVVLTHISQRYPRLPAIGSSEAFVGEGDKELQVCFGFDAMSFKLSDVRKLQSMVPRMGELLAETEE